MSEGSWLVLLLGLGLASLPFLSARRLFGVLPLPSRDAKPAWLTVVELFLAYGVWVVLALLAEQRLGPVHGKDWVFWTTTLSLFVVLAFPGFVWRFLWRHRRPAASA